MSCRVIVVGGYGLFGGLLSQRLAAHSGLELLIAGRNESRGARFAAELNAESEADISFVRVDVTRPSFIDILRELSPTLLINTAGPFQGQEYDVARTCAAAGVNYVDLADGREFVAGFSTALDAAARDSGVALVSGASSVPALSSAVIDDLSKEMPRIRAIDIGISPGNRTRRGLATVSAILSYCGAPVRVWEGKEWRTRRAWVGNVRHEYAEPVGTRLLSLCDVPDLELFPSRYAPVETVTFRAGLELGVLHYAMNLLAHMRKIGAVRNWERYAKYLFTISEWFRSFGSDAGGMHVRLDGTSADGEATFRSWQLIAANGDGPYVPTLAAAAMVRRILEGKPLPSGAYACVGLLSLQDFTREMHGLSITTEVERG